MLAIRKIFWNRAKGLGGLEECPRGGLLKSEFGMTGLAFGW
jgi:hypothetical protein